MPPQGFTKGDLKKIELMTRLAAVQIIIEAGLMPPSAAGGGDTSEGDESVTNNKDNVKEVRLICSFLHESFIADPNLAKLVHFQVKQGSLSSFFTTFDLIPKLF